MFGFPISVDNYKLLDFSLAIEATFSELYAKEAASNHY